MLCDFCGDSNFRWFFRLRDGTGVQVACDACRQLVQTGDVCALTRRTVAGMVARKMVPGDRPLELRAHISAAHWKLIPLLGPVRPISAEGLTRLKLIGQQYQPGDEEWTELVAEALEAS